MIWALLGAIFFHGEVKQEKKKYLHKKNPYPDDGIQNCVIDRILLLQYDMLCFSCIFVTFEILALSHLLVQFSSQSNRL